MRVAHLATSLHGGAGIAAFRIHQSLVESGIHSTLYTLSAPNDMSSSAGVVVLKRSLIEKNFSKLVTVTQKHTVQKTRKLFTPISIHSPEISRLSGFDLMHLHNIYNLTNLRKVSLFFGKVPIALTLHDMRSFTGGCHYSSDCQKFTEGACKKCPQSRIGFQTIVKKQLEKEIQLVEKCSNVAIAAPSRWILDLAQRSAMWRRRPAHLIHNPIPDEPIPESPRNEKLINRIGFISPNLNNPYKGFDLFLGALMYLPELWWETNKIVLVGEGEIPNLFPSSRIEQIPSRSQHELMSLYKELDFVVIPSTQDNFPNIIGEAAVNGVNLILSDVGGLREAAEMFGFQMFESGNPESLANRLLNLKKINPLVIMKNAQEIFSYKRASLAYQALYDSISS